MSWDAWVSNLTQYPGVNAAAICGLDGALWSKTGEFAASGEELQALANGLNKSSAADFPSFYLNGKKFQTIRLMESMIDGKLGGSSVCAMASTQCFVIGAFIETDQKSGNNDQLGAQGGGQKVNMAVSKTKEALANSGF